MVTVETKTCGKCGRSKDRSAFYKQSKTLDGLQWHCKKCQTATRRARTPEQVKRASNYQVAWCRTRYKNDPAFRERLLLKNSARQRAQRAPAEGTVEYMQILRRDPCCYCGAEMQHVDHIVPVVADGSPSWDNLTAACARCNTRKRTKTLLTFMRDSHD